MKKYFYIFIISLVMAFSFSSCEVAYGYATTQDDIYYEAQADMVRSDVDFNIVIRYGTPYYYEGSLLYYFYDGLYYYPFYYDNYWYVRAYRRPFTYLGYRPYFRPHRYDYRFAPGYYRGFDRPHYDGRYRGNRFGHGGYQQRPHYDARPGNGNHQHRPEVRPNDRPNSRNGMGPTQQPTRPNRTITPRPSTPSRNMTPRSSSPRMSTPSSGGHRSSGGRFGGRR